MACWCALGKLGCLDRELSWFDEFGCADDTGYGVSFPDSFISSDAAALSESHVFESLGKESCSRYPRHDSTTSFALPVECCINRLDHTENGTNGLNNVASIDGNRGSGEVDEVGAHSHGYGDNADIHENKGNEKHVMVRLNIECRGFKEDANGDNTGIHVECHALKLMQLKEGAKGIQILSESQNLNIIADAQGAKEMHALSERQNLKGSAVIVDAQETQQISKSIENCDLVDTQVSETQAICFGIDSQGKRKGEHREKVKKRQRKYHQEHCHFASGPWNLSREQGNKLLANRFRADSLYICDWPGCIHPGDKRKYKLFRGVFKNFKNSHVWRNLKDMQAKSTNMRCAFCVCKSTWDMVTTFCLKRSIEYHDDGEPVVRAYVCENGHVAGAWTDRPMYTL